jgi:hypothetical protein
VFGRRLGISIRIVEETQAELRWLHLRIPQAGWDLNTCIARSDCLFAADFKTWNLVERCGCFNFFRRWQPANGY